MLVNPVIFPPGRAKLSMSPAPTASATTAKTMGIVLVACLAAIADGVLVVTMTSTLRRASSVASSCRRSTCPLANRYSTVRFCPSLYPSSYMPCRNASASAEGPGAPKNMNPTRETFPPLLPPGGEWPSQRPKREPAEERAAVHQPRIEGPVCGALGEKDPFATDEHATGTDPHYHLAWSDRGSRRRSSIIVRPVS